MLTTVLVLSSKSIQIIKLYIKVSQIYLQAIRKPEFIRNSLVDLKEQRLEKVKNFLELIYQDVDNSLEEWYTSFTEDLKVLVDLAYDLSYRRHYDTVRQTDINILSDNSDCSPFIVTLNLLQGHKLILKLLFYNEFLCTLSKVQCIAQLLDQIIDLFKCQKENKELFFFDLKS
ncbi:MAG: hypothetical protein LF888_00380 [Candidatus Megaira endosymbiont of Mesostigma viride]|nr:MAG: hypothetical protein LF888_00380 [Candidatus Megaira endosymbiont of Mesostigma viride]